MRLHVVLALTLIAATCRASVLYSLTDVGQVPGTMSGTAIGINSFGQVVGYQTDPSVGNGHPFLWTPSTPNGKTGTIIDLGELLPGEGATAKGINDFGQVTGADGHEEAWGVVGAAFVWTPSAPNTNSGSMVLIVAPASLPHGSTGLGINASGQIAGYANDLLDYDHPFLWTPTSTHGTTGASVQLIPPDRASATAINAYGEVVGNNSSSGDAFVWVPATANGSSGTMVDLGLLLPPADFSQGMGINSAGQVVGFSSAGAFLWTPDSPHATIGSMLVLGDGVAQGINDVGQIVGSVGITRYTSHAMIWVQGAQGIDLNTVLDSTGTGWELDTAYAINNAGQIVGSGNYDPDGPGGVDAIPRAFLLNPVPEPASVGLIAGMLVLARRRLR